MFFRLLYNTFQAIDVAIHIHLISASDSMWIRKCLYDCCVPRAKKKIGHTNYGIRIDGICKYVNISTTAVQHLRNKIFNQNTHTSKYMFRVLLYNTAAAAADNLRTQTAPLTSPVAFARG